MTQLSNPTIAAEISARLDRLPATRYIWKLVLLLSLGGCFEMYDLFFTAYIGPGLVRSGLFSSSSASFFGFNGLASFVAATFAELGMEWEKFVEFDPRYLRPAEVDFLQGDASKARAKLGWQPRVDFKQLVKMMVAHDLDLARQEKTLKGAGYGVSLRGAAAS